MRSRGLVVAIAVVLAIVAAAAVILYTNGVKNDAVTGGALSVVVVSKQDIAANTNLNPLLEEGAFTELKVPTDAVVDGAVTSIERLRGQTTTAPILANEQIASARLSGGEAPQGGALGITPGNVGLPHGARGWSRRLRPDPARRQRRRVRHLQGGRGRSEGRSSPDPVACPAREAARRRQDQRSLVVIPFKFTVTVVQSARVLNIQNPVVVEGNKFERDQHPADARPVA